ncbi:MAG: PEP/pyruvate-binding domain-containing protein [Candidatus Ancaeobacter aquaticus]|nr:PEP/pyruvate-binding domain-containing protein [Candidatus Ancaeobacter aquaticus]
MNTSPLEIETLAPQSSFSDKDAVKIKSEQLRNIVKLTTNMLEDLAQGEDPKKVIRKYKNSPYWQDSFEDMIYMENSVYNGDYAEETLLIPTGIDTFVKITKDNQVIINTAEARDTLTETLIYFSEISYPNVFDVESIDALFKYNPVYDFIRRMHSNLLKGASLKAVMKKYAEEPGWKEEFEDMIFCDNTLYIPNPTQKAEYIVTKRNKQNVFHKSKVRGNIHSFFKGPIPPKINNILNKYDDFITFAKKIYNDFDAGMPHYMIKQKYSNNPLWYKKYIEYLKYINGTLYIPYKESALSYVKINAQGTTIINSSADEKEIDENQFTHSHTIKYPLRMLPRDKIKKILLYTDDDWYRGDYVVQTMIIRSLLKMFPHAQIEVINKYPSLWEGFERVALLPKKTDYTKKEFDLVIDLKANGHRLYNAPNVIHIDKMRNSFVYTDNIKNESIPIKGAPIYSFGINDEDMDIFNQKDEPEATMGNSYRFYSRLAETFGGGEIGDIKSILSVSKQEKNTMLDLLKKSGITNPEKKYIIILNPFSRMEKKELSAKTWIMIIQRLQTIIPPNGVIIVEQGYTDNHKEKIDTIKHEIFKTKNLDKDRVKLLISPDSEHKQLSLRKLIVLISVCDMLIGPDTFSSHAANAFEKDTITVYTKKLREYFRPLEFNGISPNSVFIELTPDEQVFPADIIDENELEFMAAAFKSFGLIKDRKFNAFFTKNKIPKKTIENLNFYFERLFESVSEKKYDEALKLWQDFALLNNKDFRHLVSRIREPYRTLFTEEINMLPHYIVRKDPANPGIAGYLLASNLYKFVSQINAYLGFRILLKQRVKKRLDKYIMSQNELGKEDTDIVGIKGAYISELNKIDNVNTPRGFIVSKTAFKTFMQHNKSLAQSIRNTLHTLDCKNLSKVITAATQIKKRICEAPLPKILDQIITDSYINLCKDLDHPDNALPVAVRNSLISEKLPPSSLAGQMHTDLNVIGIDAVKESIKESWASLFTARNILQRIDVGLDPMDAESSIIIQQMINSKISGTGFNFDLASGWHEPKSGVVSFDVSYGLGESIVKGLTNPDRFLLHYNSETQSWNIVAKSPGAKKIVIVPNGEGTKSTATAPSHKEKFAITDIRSKNIAETLSRISQYFGNDMKIEFAIDSEDRLWITDAFPETIANQPSYIVNLKKKTVPMDAAREAQIITQGIRGYGAHTGTAVVINVDQIESEIINKIGKPVKEMNEEEETLYESLRLQKLTRELKKIKRGNILVTKMTSPNMILALRNAGGIVADLGGTTSHASIVSRERDIPTVIGTQNATQVIRTGDLITVDANTGKVYKGKLPVIIEGEDIDTRKLPKTKTKVGLIITTPNKARKIAALQYANCHYGMSLVRGEFILGEIGIHPEILEAYDFFTRAVNQGITDYRSKTFNSLVKNKEMRKYVLKIRDNNALRNHITNMITGYPSGKAFYVQKVSQAIAAIAATTLPEQRVIYRITDYKTNEFQKLIGGNVIEGEEANPAMGKRGLARMLDMKNHSTFAWEMEAIKKARDMGYYNIAIMFPLVRRPSNLEEGIKQLERHGLKRGQKNLKVGMMIETPANVFQIDEFLDKGLDFVSFGTNDLTQFMLGCERDNKKLERLFNESAPSIIKSILYVAAICKKRGVETGFCGQMIANNPDTAIMIAPFLDSVGVTPDAYFQTVQNIADFEKIISKKKSTSAQSDSYTIPKNVGYPETVSIYEISGNRLFLKRIEKHPLSFTDREKEAFIDLVKDRIIQLSPTAGKNDTLVYSVTDLPVNAYLSLENSKLFETHEENPLIGFRGMTRHLANKNNEALFRLELQGVKKARNKGYNVGILLKMVRTLEELDQALAIIKEEGLDDAPIGFDISVSANLIMIHEILQRKIDFVTVNKTSLAQNLLASEIADDRFLKKDLHSEKVKKSELAELLLTALVKNPESLIQYLKIENALINPLKIVSTACETHKTKMGYLYNETTKRAGVELKTWKNLAIANKMPQEELDAFFENIEINREIIPLSKLIPTQNIIFSDEIEVRKDELKIGIMAPILAIRYGPNSKETYIVDEHGHYRSYLAYKEGHKEIEALVIVLPSTIDNLPPALESMSKIQEVIKTGNLKTIADIEVKKGSTELSLFEGYEKKEEKPKKFIVDINENLIPLFIAREYPGAKRVPSTTTLLHLISSNEYTYLFTTRPSIPPFVFNEDQIKQTAEFSKNFEYFIYNKSIIIIPKDLITKAISNDLNNITSLTSESP